jgi:hypothetical protein
MKELMTRMETTTSLTLAVVVWILNEAQFVKEDVIRGSL